jgi:hypothetical protein
MQQAGRWDKFRSRLCAKGEGGDQGGNSATEASGTRGTKHDQKKAKRILHINAK